MQHRHDEVAVLPLGTRHVDFQPEAKPEQGLGPLAIVDQPVERREERRSPHGPGIRVGMCAPAASIPYNAQRAKPTFRKVRIGLIVREWLDPRIPSPREVPETLRAPAASDNGGAS